eukprot:TRINITY_DN4068_c0_g1_i1.p1 TRINITY_DN4068_c0_g1~~TRINITY_DN4068_c0_g1_i1.p1  ORF type:complete len:338 (+),score=103.87 TRINITY_DN4068_c0_g1_i1:1084-2097(+)
MKGGSLSLGGGRQSAVPLPLPSSPPPPLSHKHIHVMAGRGFAMPGMAGPGGPPRRPPARPSGAPGGGRGPAPKIPGRGPAPGFGMFAPPKKGDSPKVQQASELWNSAVENDLAGVKKAIADGADVNTKDLKDVTPLLIAVTHKNKQMIEFLLQSKANVNAASLSSSPLHEAVRQHDPSIVDIILKAGADVNIQTDGGKTPLHCAAQEEQPEIFDMLVAKRAKASIHNDADTTLLHFAASVDSRTIMEKSLAQKVDPNSRNRNGKTPLHVAVEKNNLDSIRLLLNAGADKTIRDGWNRLAEECGKVSAYNLLKHHVAGQKYDLIDESEFEASSERKKH